MKRTAIVTGASAGIGLAVTAELCAGGFAVTMAARGAQRLEDAARQLRSGGADVDTAVLDVTAGGAAARLVADHLQRHAGLDVVVANAGWGTSGTAASTRGDDLARMLQANVTATFALASAAVPALRRANVSGGSAWFVITASLVGAWPAPGFAAYSATKAAAISLARSIATEEADNGVRACAICPAFVDTDMTAWLAGQLPANEMLATSDVAAAVRLLVSLSPHASITELILRRAGAPDPHTP